MSSPNFFQIPTHFFGFFLLWCWLHCSASRAYPNGCEHEPTALFTFPVRRRVLTSNAGIPEYILPVTFRVPHSMPINISAKIKYSEFGLVWRCPGPSSNHLKPQRQAGC